MLIKLPLLPANLGRGLHSNLSAIRRVLFCKKHKWAIGQVVESQFKGDPSRIQHLVTFNAIFQRSPSKFQIQSAVFENIVASLIVLDMDLDNILVFKYSLLFYLY